MQRKMWITGKVDQTSQKDSVFNELFLECKLSAPSARLSYSLRNKLERFSKEERKEIVSRVKEGYTPLFIAAKRGNVEVVDYLVVQCNADVEQKGVYEVPDDRSTHYVSPLWCACVAGKLPVVKYLVEHGADVNSISDSGSTPVRSACFMTHLDIVRYLVEHGADFQKPNYNGGTCLINSVQSVPLCEYLLKNGADVNTLDIQSKTALHYSIQEHRFETTKLLVEHNADAMMKSRYGDDALQTACLKGATQIFEYLIEKLDYTRERIAEGHELMGSTFLDEHHDLQAALLHWRKALEIRSRDIPLAKPNIVPLRPAYLNAVEFSTPAELDLVVLDLDAMRIQSLLVCERILGLYHKDFLFKLMYRGAAYADSLQYQRCIELWKFTLHLRIIKDGLLHNEVSFVVQALVRLFLDLYERNKMGLLEEELQYQDVVDTIRLLVDQFDESMKLLRIQPVFKRQQDNFDKILKVLTHLLYILSVIPKTEVQLKEVKTIISSILLLRPCSSAGDTLLHLVVSKDNTMKQNAFFDDPYAAIFPDKGVAVLLLEYGCAVDATNHQLNTALHVACQQRNYNANVVKVLLEYGAHLDRRNISGKFPYQLLANIPDSTINPLQHVSLKCLAARKIMEQKIPYIGEVPVYLESFIQIH